MAIMDDHKKSVSEIASVVRRFYDFKESFWIYHGSTNSTRPISFERTRMVDTSEFRRIIFLNKKEATVIVEPNVSMDDLVAATLPYGLIPPVVPEFPGITVGGAFAGTAGESSSYKHGFFDRTVNWVEMVLANGDCLIASPNNDHSDLYRAAGGSFGALGVLTSMEIQLMKAEPHVKVTYHPVATLSEAVKLLKKLIVDPQIEYLDGIIYSVDKIVIISGQPTKLGPHQGAKMQHFTRAFDPWFFLHAKKMMVKGEVTSEITPLPDYLFRYDRGAFWTGIYAFQYFMMPFNRITRWALDYLMHTRVMYRALHASGYSRRYIIQDVAVPLNKSEEFFEFLNESYGIYPLWICPLKQGLEKSFNPIIGPSNRNEGHGSTIAGEKESHEEEDSTDAGISLNFGVWGPGSLDWHKFVDQNRRLENKVRELGGLKWLYAHTFYTEDEFWQIYDRKWYDAMREKYHATSLPSVYEKVRVSFSKKSLECMSENPLVKALWNVWPTSALYGIYKALTDRHFLIKKR